jgi:DNA-binding MarR family transcriptional regulator
LTARGQSLEAPLMNLATEVVAAALHGVSPAEVATLRHGLLAMLQNLNEPV